MMLKHIIIDWRGREGGGGGEERERERKRKREREHEIVYIYIYMCIFLFCSWTTFMRSRCHTYVVNSPVRPEY